MAAKLNAEFLRPERWHSITVEVRMGTTSGKEVEELIGQMGWEVEEGMSVEVGEHSKCASVHV